MSATASADTNPKEPVMTRFYKKRTSNTKSRNEYRITIIQPDGHGIEVEVTEQLYRELDDMQREHWRGEKAESRHTRFLEQVPSWCLPESTHVPSPEQLMMERLEESELHSALRLLPKKQLRRFLLRNYFDLSLEEIAGIEGCSIQTVHESISRARKNLRKNLGIDT